MYEWGCRVSQSVSCRLQGSLMTTERAFCMIECLQRVVRGNTRTLNRDVCIDVVFGNEKEECEWCRKGSCHQHNLSINHHAESVWGGGDGCLLHSMSGLKYPPIEHHAQDITSNCHHSLCVCVSECVCVCLFSCPH